MNKKITNIIILIIRLLVGIMLVWASYKKLTNMEQTIGIFSQYFGLNAGITWAVAIGELLTGLGILFGVLTKFAAIGAVIIMGGAVYYSLDIYAILLLIGSVVLMITGSGKFAIKPCKPLISKDCDEKCDCEK